MDFWTTPTYPYSLPLHILLPDDLDFFCFADQHSSWINYLLLSTQALINRPS